MPNSNEKYRPTSGKRLVLIVEDEFINRELLREILADSYDVLTAEDGLEALEKIQANASFLSLILLDLNMPGMHGLELLKILQADKMLSRIPVIVLTSEKESEVDSLHLGATDFIPKPYPNPEIILARVNRIVELSEDRTIIQSTERDALTGLYFKEYFYRYAEQYDQYHPSVTTDALVVDVIHFHIINERYGKAFGDLVLKRVAKTLRDLVRDSGGIVCRREGDTFLVYCPHRDDYETLVEEIPFDVRDDNGNEAHIRLRFGIYANADKDIDVERRFDRAKKAADMMRGSFSSNLSYYNNDLHKTELYNERLLEDIHQALREKQFIVFYQPKFNILGEKPVLSSAEALIRWKHPSLGMISPGVFIPLFENNGLIQKLDDYVWREAAAQIRAWKDAFGVSVPVSVNVSRIDMHDPKLVETFCSIMAENGLTPGEYLLEVTESAYSDNSAQLIRTVKELRDHGFRIEMDDFGSGYSSLNMLASLPCDILKLDMKFIQNTDNHVNGARMLKLMIDIAKYLSMPVIAEGVETEKQLQLLKELGCDVVQGYYFSKPVPPEEFERFIRERKEQC
ncbi:MAG: EAL domain-containing protein [Firmicutes bacterium]|nr:EAL domain-containing protein [Bacillota bacterium]